VLFVAGLQELPTSADAAPPVRDRDLVLAIVLALALDLDLDLDLDLRRIDLTMVCDSCILCI
jgi:hypothetical protein